jgi:hypothetical protein
MTEPNTNPIAGQVDYTQSPEDFASQATGQQPSAEGDNTTQPAEGSAAVDPNTGQPQDNGEPKTPDEPKPGEETNPDQKTPESQKTEPAPTEPEKPKLSPEEYQKKEAAKKIQSLGEGRKRAMDAHIAAIENDPDHIHVVADTDNKLADEIAKEYWGYENYDDLMEAARIEELRESDPEKANIEERLGKVEKDSRVRAEEARKQLLNVTLQQLNVSTNELDPIHGKVVENLKLLNSDFVETNYAEAIRIAHNMAIGKEVVNPQLEAEQQILNKQGGAEAANSGEKQPHTGTSPYNKEQTAFADVVGAKL